MTDESSVRRAVLATMKRHNLDPVAIESTTKKGIPDVECVLGWLEIKYKPNWTKGGYLNLKQLKFTQSQRKFLRRRHRAHKARGVGRGVGSGAFFLLVVGNCWMLFDGRTAGNLPEFLERDKIRELGALAIEHHDHMVFSDVMVRMMEMELG